MVLTGMVVSLKSEEEGRRSTDDEKTRQISECFEIIQSKNDESKEDKPGCRRGIRMRRTKHKTPNS